MPVALEVINRKLSTHISQEGPQAFLDHFPSIPKTKLYLFWNFFEQLYILPTQVLQTILGRSYGFTSLPSYSKYYMEYFEQLALRQQCPICTPWWKRYVDDVICITKKVDILFNCMNQLDYHIKCTMESPDNEASITFLDTKCNTNSNHIIHPTVYRNPHILTSIWIGIQTIQYLPKGQLYKHWPTEPK